MYVHTVCTKPFLFLKGPAGYEVTLVYDRTSLFSVYAQCSGITIAIADGHMAVTTPWIYPCSGGKGKPAKISHVISVLVGEIIKHEVVALLGKFYLFLQMQHAHWVHVYVLYIA